MAINIRDKISIIRKAAATNRSIPISSKKDEDEELNLSLVERRREINSRLSSMRAQMENDFRANEPKANPLQPKFGGATLSAPTGNETSSPTNQKLNTAEEAMKKYEEDNRKRGAPIRDFIRRELGGLGKFFFGESEETMRYGKSENSSYRNIEDVGEKGFVDGIRDDVKTRGVVRFLYQNILMEDEEKIRNNTAELQRQGYQYSEAREMASQYTAGNKDSIEDDVAVRQLDDMERTRKAWAAVELLDVTPIISGFVKSAGKTYVRQTLERSMAAENAKEARKIILEMLPELKGTKALDEVVALSQTMRDPIQGENLLREIVRTGDRAPAGATTEAQRVVYENGVPVLRAGRGSQNVNDIVNVRDEIRAAVKGEMEGRRLSGDDVLNDELRAGVLKFGTTADSTVPVFTTRDINKLSLGERVALDPTVARESLEGGAEATEIMVKVDDLVRLDDGTFVYAPKKAVTTEFSPQIKAVQDKMRQKTIDAEKRRAQLARDVKVAERQLAEADRRIARQQAEAVLKKEAEKLNIAKKTVETGVEELSKLKSKIDTETKATVKQRMTALKEAKDTISTQRTQLNKLLKNLQKVRAARKKLPEEYKKKIEAIRSGKTKVRVGKEELPDDLQEMEIRIDLQEEVVETHPAKGLARYSQKKGEFQGLLPEQMKGLDGRVSEISEGKYNSLDEARAGYQDYKTQKEVLSDMKAELREDKAAWKAEAKSRAGANLEKAKTKAINDLQAEKIAKSKELMKSEDGLKKGTEQLDEGIKAAEKANPDVGKTAAQIRKEVAAPAQAKKKQLTKNSKEQIAKAKNRLKEAGVEEPKKGIKTPRITPKQVKEINAAKTSYKEGVKEVKQFENSIPDKPRRNFDPIESDGKKLSTKMNEDIARRTGYEDGVPPEFRQATIKKEYRQLNLQKDQQNAIQMVIEDPIGIYQKFIADIDLGAKATRASIGNALISHPQIASSPFRLDEVYRALQGTREAQEFVARRNIGDLDVVNFMNNLNKRGEDILAKRGVDLKAEIEKAWKAAGIDKAREQRAISRKSVEKVLKTNLC